MYNKLIIYFFGTIIISNVVLGYSIGYTDYGMDRTKANNVLKQFTEEQTANLTIIIFSNVECVRHFFGKCALASYEYLGNTKNIKIGNYNKIDENELTRLLKHELKHHEQNLQGRLPNTWGLPYQLEWEAEDAEIS